MLNINTMIHLLVISLQLGWVQQLVSHHLVLVVGLLAHLRLRESTLVQ